MLRRDLKLCVVGALSRHGSSSRIPVSAFTEALEGLGLEFGMPVVDDLLCQCAIQGEGVDFSEFRDAVEREENLGAPAPGPPTSRAWGPAPVQPARMRASAALASRQASIARDKRTQLRDLFRSYSMGRVDDAEVVRRVQDLGLAATSDLEAALAKARSSNDLALASFLRTLTLGDGAPVALGTAALQGHPSRPAYREEAAGQRRDTPSIRRTDPSRNASMFGKREDEPALPPRREPSRLCSSSSSSFEVDDEARQVSRSRLETRRALDPGWDAPAVRQLQRQQILAAVRKLGSGDVTAAQFQDRVFAMGVQVPPDVLKLLLDHQASGEAKLSRFAAAFDRLFFFDRENDDARDLISAARRTGDPLALRNFFVALGDGGSYDDFRAAADRAFGGGGGLPDLRGVYARFRDGDRLKSRDLLAAVSRNFSQRRRAIVAQAFKQHPDHPDFDDLHAAVSPLVDDDVDFEKWVRATWRVEQPNPNRNNRRRNPRPLAGQTHGDLLAWTTRASPLETRDTPRRAPKVAPTAVHTHHYDVSDWGTASRDEQAAEMNQVFGVKRTSPLTLAHHAGEKGILAWYNHPATVMNTRPPPSTRKLKDLVAQPSSDPQNR